VLTLISLNKWTFADMLSGSLYRQWASFDHAIILFSYRPPSRRLPRSATDTLFYAIQARNRPVFMGVIPVIPEVWRRVRLILGGLAILWGGMVNLFLLGNSLGVSPTAFVLMNQIAPWITLLSLLVFSLAFTLRAQRWLVL
jgi:hypothetical protein